MLRISTFHYRTSGSLEFLLIFRPNMITLVTMKIVVVRGHLDKISPSSNKDRASDFLRKCGNRDAVSYCLATVSSSANLENRASAF